MGSFLCNIIGRERKIDREIEKDEIIGGKGEKERKKEWQEERERDWMQKVIKRGNKKDKYWEEEGKKENLWYRIRWEKKEKKDRIRERKKK